MDPNALITIGIGIAGVVGGFASGRKSGNQEALSTAVQTVGLLQTQLETVKEYLEEKSVEVHDLNVRVEVLEGLVTQRAQVQEVKEVVDRIAVKVGA